MLVPPMTAAFRGLDWTNIEHRLGFQLPLDYRELVDTYGQGSFDRFIWVLQPSSTNHNLDMVRQRRERLAALRTLRDSGEPTPFGAEELAPWAITDNGDVCYWVISALDLPDEWTIAVNEARGQRWLSFEFGAAEFLVAVLSERLRVEVFPEDFPSRRPTFGADTT